MVNPGGSWPHLSAEGGAWTLDQLGLSQPGGSLSFWASICFAQFFLPAFNTYYSFCDGNELAGTLAFGFLVSSTRGTYGYHLSQ